MLRRMSNDVAGMKTIMEEICQTDTHNDFMSMEVLGTRKITPEKKYPGIGINLMAHIKNVRIPFSVDIGVDDVIVPGAVKRTVATRLGLHTFQELAKDAKGVYHVKRVVLVNTEIVDEYLENFRDEL